MFQGTAEIPEDKNYSLIMKYNPKQTAKSTEEVIFQDVRNLIYNPLVMKKLWGIPKFFWPYAPDHYQNHNEDPTCTPSWASQPRVTSSRKCYPWGLGQGVILFQRWVAKARSWRPALGRDKRFRETKLGQEGKGPDSRYESSEEETSAFRAWKPLFGI